MRSGNRNLIRGTNQIILKMSKTKNCKVEEGMEENELATAWIRLSDSKSGKKYYFNPASIISRWHRPRNRWYKANLVKVGKRKVDRIYYFNPYLQQTSYRKPLNYHFEDEGLDSCILAHTQKRGSTDISVPCLEESSNKVYWYNTTTGTRAWNKPSWCKHPFEFKNTENSRLGLHAEGRDVQDAYHEASDRMEKLSNRLEKLKIDIKRREKRLKDLEKQMDKSIKKKHHHMSMNIMASAVRVAFTRPNENSFVTFKSNDVNPILSFLKSIDIFLYLTEEQFAYLAMEVKPVEFKPNQIIIDKDKDSDKLIIIESGTVGVYTDEITANQLKLEKLPMETNENSFGQKINQLYAGDYFGAREIMAGKKYNHTYVSLTLSYVYALSKASFEKIVLNGSGFEKLDFSKLRTLQQKQKTFKVQQQNQKLNKNSRKLSKKFVKDAVYHIRDVLIKQYEVQQKADKVELSSLTNYVTACSNLVALKVSNPKAKKVSKALLKLTYAFSPFLNFEDVLTRTVHALREIFKTHQCNLFKVTDVGNLKQGALSLLEDCQVKRHEIVGLDDGLVATAINTNSLVASTSLGFHEYIKDEEMMKFYDDVHAVMVCPVCTENNEVIGAIRIMRTEVNSNFTEEEQRILSAMGEQISNIFQVNLFKTSEDYLMMPLKVFHQPFKIKICKYIGAKIPNVTAGRPKEILLKVSLYNGQQQLCTPWFVQGKSTQAMVSFVQLDKVIELPISYSNIPRTANVVIEIFIVDLFTQDYYLKKLRKMNMQVRKLLDTLVTTEDDIVGTTSIKDKLLFSKQLSTVLHETFEQISPNNKQHFVDTLIQDAIPKGYTAMSLFNFEQVLITGQTNARLIDTKAFKPKYLLSNPVLDTMVRDKQKNPGIIEVDVQKPIMPREYKEDEGTPFEVVYTDHDFLSKKKLKSSFELNKMTTKSTFNSPLLQSDNDITKVRHILYADPLKKLNEVEKKLIYNYKDTLVHDPHALPRFVESVDFSVRESVLELYDYLNSWETPDPLVALNLLGPQFVDYKVRSLAVAGLANMPDETLSTFMLQLVQCLRLERFLDNALACILIAKSIENPWLVGVSFFWAVNTEIEKLTDEAGNTDLNANLIIRYRIYKDIYLRHCRNRVELGHQKFVNRKLIECHGEVENHKNVKDRQEFMRQALTRIKFPSRFRLPINNRIWCTGVKVEECTVKSSKKLPFQLTFITDSNADNIEVIFKVGDDLRQDQLTLTAFSVVDSIWKQNNMDMKLSIYRVVATSNVTGFIEVVRHSKTIATIQVGEQKYKKKILGQFRTAYNATKKDRMKALFQNSEEHIKENFIPSVAGYCVLTYILGIGDRHNDNMMMTDDLKLFHIDFGHFLGNFKKAFKVVPRETAPFVLTQQMVALMESVHSFAEFKLQFNKAFLVIRKQENANLLITLFKLMVSSDITELKEEADILWIRKKLMFDLDDTEATNEMEALIKVATAKFSTYFNHFTHIVKHHGNY